METINLDPKVCIMGALLLLILPLRWVAAVFFASLFHELGHLAAVILFNGKISEIRLGTHGACIEAWLCNRRRELMAILAGPAMSFLLILTSRLFPRLALCGFVQGTFNLLPIYPLDGGRALRTFLGENRKGERICRVVELSSISILGLGLLSTVLLLRISPIILLLYGFWLVKRCKIKIPCKLQQQRVQ